MAKKTVKVSLTIDIDEDEVGKEAHIWLYQFINRLGYEYDIKEVQINGGPKKVIKDKKDIVDLDIKRNPIA